MKVIRPDVSILSVLKDKLSAGTLPRTSHPLKRNRDPLRSEWHLDIGELGKYTVQKSLNSS